MCYRETDMRPFCLLLALAGCNWISSADVEKEKKTLDEDGDGFVASEDCDDAAANVHPGAEDAWYDGVDSNCDGGNDDDQDGDGVVVPTDCDDTDAAIGPCVIDLDWYYKGGGGCTCSTGPTDARSAGGVNDGTIAVAGG